MKNDFSTSTADQQNAVAVCILVLDDRKRNDKLKTCYNLKNMTERKKSEFFI